MSSPTKTKENSAEVTYHFCDVTKMVSIIKIRYNNLEYEFTFQHRELATKRNDPLYYLTKGDILIIKGNFDESNKKITDIEEVWLKLK